MRALASGGENQKNYILVIYLGRRPGRFRRHQRGARSNRELRHVPPPRVLPRDGDFEAGDFRGGGARRGVFPVEDGLHARPVCQR